MLPNRAVNYIILASQDSSVVCLSRVTRTARQGMRRCIVSSMLSYAKGTVRMHRLLPVVLSYNTSEAKATGWR